MAKKQTIMYAVHGALANKIAFGESKHKNKQELGFGESSYKIYSYSTYSTYKKECEEYARWLIEEKKIDKYTKLEDTKKYAKEYIEKRLNVDKVSVYTAKMERSALGMLYGKRVDIDMPKRDNKNIVRSRNETENDKHYSRTGKYRDVFSFALGTGCRRCDLENLNVNCLVEKDGHLYIKILGSKGGRDRLSPVRGEYKEEIKNIVAERKEKGEIKIFNKIPSRIDIHSLRREYAKNLYKDIVADRQLRDDILKNYPPRREYKYNINKNGEKYCKEIKKDYYKDRDGNIYDRNDLYIISQALGHNRLDVSVTHYLK